MRRSALLLLAFTLFAPTLVAAKTYEIDKNHTSVTFRIRHLFTQVSGRFDKFGGIIEFDPANPQAAKVSGTIDVASVNTNQSKRDEHLRSPDFFDAKQHPTISFASTGVADIDATKKNGKMNGTLTIHGVTKPIVLDVSYLGEAKDPLGGTMRAAFSGKTTINRKDFGLMWNEAVETGGVLVGDEVEIAIDAEGVAQH
jgi:polyisoprenoid-binding protein YceI